MLKNTNCVANLAAGACRSGDNGFDAIFFTVTLFRGFGLTNAIPEFCPLTTAKKLKAVYGKHAFDVRFHYSEVVMVT